MKNLMMIHCSNKKVNKIITAFFIIGLAMVLAFCPIVQTVALAESAQETTQQVLKVLSFLGATIWGTAASQAALVAVGISTPVMLTSALGTIITILIGLGVGVAVSSFVGWILDCLFDNCGATFWTYCKESWDRAHNKLLCSAAVFTLLVTQIKTALGIGEGSNSSSKFPYVTKNENPIDIDSTISSSKERFLSAINNDVYAYYYNNDVNLTVSQIGPYTFKIKTPISNWMADHFAIYLDDEKKFDFTFLDVPRYFVTPYLDEDKKLLYFRSVNYEFNRLDTFSPSGYCGNTLYSNDKSIYYNIYDDKGEVTQSIGLFAVDKNNTIHVTNNTLNLLYLLFVEGYALYEYPLKISVKNGEDVTNYDNSVTKVTNVTNVKNVYNTGTYSKDVTYDEEKDGISSIVDTFASATTAGNTLAGDVSIGLSDVAVGTLSQATAIADAASTTAVDASKVTAVDSAGVSTSLVNTPFIPWTTSLGLLKTASSGISDKFPFCIPSYLSEQISIIVADPKEPIFKLPFNLDTFDISETVNIDLTKFEKVTKVTDWLLVIVLIIGLCFATKKLMF